MPLELTERPTHEPTLHECATCALKERVYITTPDGRQSAAVWRCRILSQKQQAEVLVQPHENCFEHRSLTDYWQLTAAALVR